MKSIGDIVRLKSGGPFMTVNEYAAKTKIVGCCWVAESDGSPQDFAYPEGCLDGPFTYKVGSVVGPVV